MFMSNSIGKVVIFAERKNQQESSKLKEMLNIVFNQYQIQVQEY